MKEIRDSEGHVIDWAFTPPEWADELQFLDPDLRKAFEGKAYQHGVPTMIQHTRAIQQLSALMEQQHRHTCCWHGTATKEVCCICDAGQDRTAGIARNGGVHGPYRP